MCSGNSSLFLDFGNNGDQRNLKQKIAQGPPRLFCKKKKNCAGLVIDIK